MVRKKVYILGPTTDNKYFGGVAVFDDELAKGFRNLGWQVRQFTDQNVLETSLNVHKLSRKELNKFVHKEKPDLIIASLKYGIYFKSISCDAKKIYVLHGFFEREYYGLIKSTIYTIVQKYILKYSDFVISNSFFTKMINQKFFGIKTDFVQHLGVSESFLRELQVQDQHQSTIKTDYVFIGRLVSAKGIINLIEAAKILKNKNFEFNLKIVGDGPLRKYIEDQKEEYDLSIELLGRKTHQEIVSIYHESEYFISLNSSEPFGIVFLESLISGCKIICPYTGGQIETLKDYANSVMFVNESNPSDIANGIIKAKSLLQKPNVTESELKKWTYPEIAKQLIYKVKKHDK